MPRPWSKYSKGSSAFRRHTKEIEDRKNRIKDLQTHGKKKKKLKNATEEEEKKGKKENEDLEELENDPKFKEFLSLHGGKDAKKLWCNDDAVADGNGKKSEKVQEKDSSSDSSSGSNGI